VKYKSRSDIIGLLLNAANGEGATKTKLMYSAFISFNQLREYLSILVENGLIEYEEGKHTYRTTGKGIKPTNLYISSIFSGNGILFFSE
jgi:predicted transcriptional regulator